MCCAFKVSYIKFVIQFFYMLICIRMRNQGIVNNKITFSTPEKVVTHRVDRQCNGGVKKQMGPGNDASVLNIGLVRFPGPICFRAFLHHHCIVYQPYMSQLALF